MTGVQLIAVGHAAIARAHELILLGGVLGGRCPSDGAGRRQRGGPQAAFAYHRSCGCCARHVLYAPTVAVHGEAASAHENWERRYDEQSFHLLYPEFVAPPGPAFSRFP